MVLFPPLVSSCFKTEHDVTILPPTVRLCLALSKEDQEKKKRETDDEDKYILLHLAFKKHILMSGSGPCNAEIQNTNTMQTFVSQFVFL